MTETGPKYKLDIEGTIYDWDEPTISVEKIAELGGWSVSEGVILIDKDNVEHTLNADEVVELKPGMGFAKKTSFKRGEGIPRVLQELEALSRVFPDVIYRETQDGTWIYVQEYSTGDGWSVDVTPVATLIPKEYPTKPPYGFLCTAGIQFQNQSPANYTEPPPKLPPFDGNWGMFSWSPAAWKPNSDPFKEPNLVSWIRSFRKRFAEGK